MSRMFKVVLILLVVASIVSAVLAVMGYIGKEREYMKRVLLEDKLAATLQDKRRVEKELEVTNAAKEKAEFRITQIQSKIETLTSQIEKEKAKSKQMSLALAEKKQEVERLSAELEKEKNEKLRISKKLERLESDYKKVRYDVVKLKNENLQLEDKLAKLKEKSVNLDTIVVKPPEGTSAPQPQAAPQEVKEPLRGRVLVVNRDYSFIVTDLGQEDGVKKGMIFEIRDGTQFLGRAEVDKIYDSMSSATILPGSYINNIKKGNLVIESR